MGRRFIHRDASGLPVVLWLGMPLGLLMMIAVSFLFMDRAEFNKWFEGELAIIELFTPVLLLPAIYSGIRAWMSRARLPSSWTGYWVLLVTLGCIYFAGEEISWGQHLFGWRTPEDIAAMNDQRETNLHNVSSWLDQKPRLILEIFVLVGGIILPLWRLGSGRYFSANSSGYWFWPSSACLPAAVLAILSYLPERLGDHFDYAVTDIVRVSEIQEMFFAVFLWLYLASIAARLQQR